MTKKDIVERISQLRVQTGLSARELSLKIGKNDTYINRLESKRSFEPSVSALLEIISALGVTEAEFFSYDSAQYKMDLEILNQLKDIKGDKKQVVLDLLKVLKS